MLGCFVLVILERVCVKAKSSGFVDSLVTPASRRTLLVRTWWFKIDFSVGFDGLFLLDIVGSIGDRLISSSVGIESFELVSGSASCR